VPLKIATSRLIGTQTALFVFLASAAAAGGVATDFGFCADKGLGDITKSGKQCPGKHAGMLRQPPARFSALTISGIAELGEAQSGAETKKLADDGL